MFAMIQAAAYVGVVALANIATLAALWIWGDWYPTSLESWSAAPAVLAHAVISLALLPVLRSGERFAGYVASTLTNSITLVGSVLVSSHTAISDPLIITTCCFIILLFNVLILTRFVVVKSERPSMADE